ncbi:MAG: biopolymer transporter ExbD [Opitutaceae bacterium]|nr:biopolymer transporter ExbD [Opitutaceae bacterium]|tara:strand:- start:3921 stop:4325 length:405 start_codon:yes stop_codon:yes gene_type:complete
MKGRKSLTENEELSNINISPMIDMVFILLIFFIVTTVFVEEPGVDIEKPITQSAYALEKNSILIAITGNNEVVFGGKQRGVSEIRPIVRRLNARKAMPVILQVDKNASAITVIRVIDEAKLGKANEINISSDLR